MPAASAPTDARQPAAPTPSVTRVGISLPNRLPLLGLPANDLIVLAERAEASGLVGSVWAGDSLLTKPRLESLTLLGSVATRTGRVRIGTLCLASLAFREPILLAIQAATLDHLSGGRLVLGVCVGPGSGGGQAAQGELARFGLSGSARLRAFEENITRLRQLWGQAGDGGGGDDRPIEPRPLQARLPILVAGSPARATPEVATRVLDRIARLGDGWIADAISADRFRELKATLMEAADRHGRATSIRETVIHVPVVVAPDRRAARATARGFLARHVGVRIGDVSLPEAGAYGPPELVLDHLAGLLEAGVDTPVLRMMSPDPLGQLDRLLTDVLERLGPTAPVPDHA